MHITSGSSVIHDVASDDTITILTALEHAARHCRGHSYSDYEPGRPDVGSKIAEKYDELSAKLLVAVAVARRQDARAATRNGSCQPIRTGS